MVERVLGVHVSLSICKLIFNLQLIFKRCSSLSLPSVPSMGFVRVEPATSLSTRAGGKLPWTTGFKGNKYSEEAGQWESDSLKIRSLDPAS